MKKGKTIQAPLFDLFLVAVTYNALILLLLLTLFGEKNSFSELAAYYLMLGAPLLMGIVMYRNYDWKADLHYHRMAYRAAQIFFILSPLIFLLIVMT